MSLSLRQKINLLIQDLSEKESVELADYIVFLKIGRKNEVFKDLLSASESQYEILVQ